MSGEGRFWLLMTRGAEDPQAHALRVALLERLLVRLCQHHPESFTDAAWGYGIADNEDFRGERDRGPLKHLWAVTGRPPSQLDKVSGYDPDRGGKAARDRIAYAQEAYGTVVIEHGGAHWLRELLPKDWEVLHERVTNRSRRHIVLRPPWGCCEGCPHQFVCALERPL